MAKDYEMIEELLRDEPGFNETRAAIRETVDKIRNDEERVERGERYEQFVQPQGLFDAMADTVFISAPWLLEQERGYVLPKRGELPPEALISADDLRRSYDGRDKTFNTVQIVAVSHCWRTREHPDPEGVTTKILQDHLERVCYRYVFSDVGIFFDWCSLWREPRTSEQQESFDRALHSITLWYAHRLTIVWLVTDALGYRDRGWTMFEWALTLMKTVSELGSGLGITWQTPKLPVEALAFFDGHLYGDQAYTNAADRDVVALLYKKATEDILSGVNELIYGD